MAKVIFNAGVIDTTPAYGQELYRTDSNGHKRMLTGMDYNLELRRQKALQLAHLNPRIREDAVGMALEEDLRARKSEFWEDDQRALESELFLPMDPEAGSFANAEEYIWEKRTAQGEAVMHASLNGTTEATDVSESAAFQKVPIFNAIISYGHTVQDDMIARQTGDNFGFRRASLARDAIGRAFDRFNLLGTGVAGRGGLFNHTGVTALVAATGTWYAGGASAELVEADFRQLHTAVLNATVNGSSSERPDTVAMSDRVEAYLRFTKVDVTNRMSRLDQLKFDYPEIKNWLVHADLRDISASGFDRIVMYRKDPRVIAGAIPVAYQERPTIIEPFGERTYAFGRIAPAELHDSRLIQYLDVDVVAP